VLTASASSILVVVLASTTSTSVLVDELVRPVLPASSSTVLYQ
jgi:hypothetical protein